MSNKAIDKDYLLRQLQAFESDVLAQKSIATQEGYHNLRYYNNKFSYKSGNTWTDIDLGGSSGGGGSSYTAGDGISISNDEISTDNMSAADMAEVAYPLPGVTPKLMKYSTSEQMVGYWIDGKPIYQRVLTGQLGTITDGVMTNQNNDVSSWSIDNIIQMNGILSNTYIFPTISDSYNRQVRVRFIKDENWIQIQCDQVSWSNKSYHLIIQYTKTTDSALSI